MGAISFSVNIHSADMVTRSAFSTTTLRVCADPNNLPFSNKAQEGFENKIIALIADELGLPIQYTWFPQTVGYIRNTLQIHRCDLISGITTSSERVQNTNPYYYSVYALVYPEEETLPTDFSNPIYRDKKIGVVAGTPPVRMLAMHGLLSQVIPYQLTVDTRNFSPATQAIKDVDEGLSDAAIIWGPIAGYYTQHNKRKLVVRPLVGLGKDFTLGFRITMAVRFNDQELKKKINQILSDRETDIISILKQYHVPILNNLGQQIQ